MGNTKTITGNWVIKETTELDELIVAENSSITAPEGKYVTMTVNGRGTAIEPGTYSGNIVLSVAEYFECESTRFGQTEINRFKAGAVIVDGKYQPKYSVPAIVQGGYVKDGEAGDVYINTREWDFDGFYITGDGEYTINNLTMSMVGDGTDDFTGTGAGVAVSGNAKVTLNNAEIHSYGISRGAAFVGGNSEVTFNDCFFTLCSGTYIPEELKARMAGGYRMMEPPWGMGITGYGRTTNLAGMATANYNRCHVVSSSWGILSIDGGCVTRLNVKDSLLECTGESGYGVFSIADDIVFDYAGYGDYGSYDVIDHSVMKGVTYPIIMSLGNAGGEFKNGSKIYSKWGCLCFRNSGGVLNINSGTLLRTKYASLLCKGANSSFNLDNAILEPGNGVIMQLMDNDETGMAGPDFIVPIGENDVYVEGRDLYNADPNEDVFVTVSNMEAVGDFYNSTTALYANCRPDPNAPPMPPMDFGKIRGFDKDLQGPKNLDVKIKNATVKGMISSAKQEYISGLKRITKAEYQELSHIRQWSAEPVNNGVILAVDGASTWIVTGDCWLTKLTIEDGAIIKTEDGKTLSMTVDGKETGMAAGTYTGVIKISVK